MSASPVADWLDRWAEKTPAAPALISGEEVLSYRDLPARVRRAADGLADTGPLLPCFEVGLDLALLAHAAPRAGVALFPLDPNLPEGVRARFVELCAQTRRTGPFTPDSVHLVIATSGSSGEPKGVMLSGRNIEAAVTASRRRLGLGAGDCWLCCLPLHHIGGVSILYRAIEAGACVRLHDRFDADRVWREVAAGGVSHLSLVPVMLSKLLDAAADAAPPADLRVVLVGGAALAPDLAARSARAGWPVRPTYGMSEGASQVATGPVSGADWTPGAVGRPLDGFEVAISDPRDGIGRILIRGPAVMKGYLTPSLAPGRGLEADGSFLSRDLGRIEADGALMVLGRADDAFTSGGETIHPLTVEAVLARCPGVDEVAVAGRPDPLWGMVVVAVFAGAASADEVLAWSHQALGGAWRPRAAIKLAALPRNAIGKPDRRSLTGLVGNET